MLDQQTMYIGDNTDVLITLMGQKQDEWIKKGDEVNSVDSDSIQYT